MPSHSPSTIDWFHRRRRTAAPKDPYQAFLSRLLHLLAADASWREPPPVSLPGRPNGSVAPEPAPPVSSWQVGKADRPMPSDGDPPYSAAELEQMNQRFAAALERAIKHGKERPAMKLLPTKNM
jgi:hypothetical protein